MGTTLEEQQAAREEYQAKVRESRRGAKPVNINQTHETPNPVIEDETVGETHDSRKNETEAEEIIENGEALGTYGKPAVQLEEGEKDEIRGVTSSEDASGDDQVESSAEEVGEPDAPEKPSHSDKKAEWVAYAAKLTGESEEDINEKHTKEDLVAKFG